MICPLPIIMYHEYPSAALFEHLRWVKGKFTPVHLSELVDYFIQPTWDQYQKIQKSPDSLPKIVLTFDDALHDSFINVYPLLRDFNFKATICVPTGYVSESSVWRKVDNWENNEQSTNPIMTWKELKELTDCKTSAGDTLFEIIPHSVNHRPFDKIENDREELSFQVNESKNVLMNNLGISEPRFFCFPGGAGWKLDERSPINEVLANCGYIGALRAEYNGEEWNRFCIPRWAASDVSTINEIFNVIPKN